MVNNLYVGSCCICATDVDGRDGSAVVDYLDRKGRRGAVLMCAECHDEWPLGEGWRMYAKRVAGSERVAAVG